MIEELEEYRDINNGKIKDFINYLMINNLESYISNIIDDETINEAIISIIKCCLINTVDNIINIDKINSYLKKSTRNDEVLLEIEAGRADMDDMRD